MKAIILAGGSGDRLWPLSRKNYPKQFIQFNNEQSLFQDTITRNIPYVDEFVILANAQNREIVEGQMQRFQGLSYRFIFEEEGRGTAFAIAMALHVLEEEEIVLITPSDLMLQGEGYSEAIYQAKEFAENDRICLFGVEPKNPSTSFGYICHSGATVEQFIEKPTKEIATELYQQKNVSWNGGLTVAKVSCILEEIKRFDESIYHTGKAICKQYDKDEKEIFVLKKDTDTIAPIGFDSLVLERSDKLSLVLLKCLWSDICDFESYQEAMKVKQNNIILADSNNTSVINSSSHQLVVANGLSDMMVVNTPDAVYVSHKDNVDNIKDIISNNYTKYEKHFDRSYLDDRPWGTREILKKDIGYRVRKIVIYPGLKLSNHMHERRNENYAVVSGILTVELEDKTIEVHAGETINIVPKVMHLLRNNTDEDVVVIEVDTGAEIDEWDMVHSDEIDKQTAPKKAKDKADMSLPNLYKLTPAYKDYIWGGQKLKEIFGKNTPYTITAESWELSAHPQGSSIISDGEFSGMPFKDFIEKYKDDVCGWKAKTFDRFPILIKFIDATNALSIQIHPEDDYAFVNENEFGKNEMWYILDCERDAYLYCGLKKDTTKEVLQGSIEDKTVTDLLNKIPVKKGDVIFVPAGTIHAIGKGILLCEIQQNSNSTYRLFDYDRVDGDGKPRPLHIKKGMDVVDTSAFLVEKTGIGEPIVYDRSTQRLLCQCKYFEVKKYEIPQYEIIMIDDSSFKSIVVLKGECIINCGKEKYKAKAGDSFFVAAGRKRVHVEGECELIVTNI